MTINQKPIDNVTDDFGFSFENENPISDFSIDEYLLTQAEVIKLRKDVETYRSANRDIIKRITILMNNLKKNPDKPMIKWPDRVATIDKFLKEINEIHTNKTQD